MMQSLNKFPRWFNFGLVFPLVFLNGWLLFVLVQSLQPLLTILISASLIAFLLDYPIRFLENRGMGRGWAAGLVLLLFVVILGTVGLFLGPVILRQANELLTRLPEWIKSGQQQLRSLEVWAADQQLPVDLSTSLNQLIERLTSILRSLTSQLVGLIFSAIGSIVNVFLTLVFTIFMVLRGDSLWRGILGWLPNQWDAQIRQSLPRNFERYIAGQVTMSVLIGIAQTTALLILKVPLAQLFGVGIGVASLIPFGGATTIVTVSILLALQNFWFGVKVLVVTVVISQLLENVLAPRILGELTGLNPVWMLISLDIGVNLGGVLGLVVAVPIASFIKATVDTIRATKPNSPIVLRDAPSTPQPEINLTKT